MPRVAIADIMRETGLSRATVDRALNARGKVHARTRELVQQTLARLAHPHAPPAGPAADILLRIGQGLMLQLRAAWAQARPDGEFHDLRRADEASVLAAIDLHGADLSRPLIVTAKNSEPVVARLAEARRAGKRVIAFLSDLNPIARDAFVGIDNRAAGQTAAFLIGRALGDRPTSVGVVVGDAAFRGHEDREIGFRTALRAHFPKIALSGEAFGEDDSDLTREAVARMLRDQPALGAIYNVGGGNRGLVEALQAAGRGDDVLVVAHETNAVTTPLLRDNRLAFALASDPAMLLASALRVAADAGADAECLDFGVYTRFNLPAFAASGGG
ncbi:MAG: LacI family DNA-binding transcriptional regulator [Pseudomonadota bacterium]|nr:LacI family DNA-binding transcriptional regulator [Pseudomonadota bacterium]